MKTVHSIPNYLHAANIQHVMYCNTIFYIIIQKFYDLQNHAIEPGVHQQGLVYQNITSVINIKTVGTIVMSLKVVVSFLHV